MPGKDLVPRPAVQPPAVQDVPPWARDKRETVTAWTWLYRRRHWTLPAFLPVPVWLGGLAVHVFGLTMYVCVAGLVAFGAIVLIGSAKWERKPELLYATASVVLLAGWLALAGLFGPARLWLVIAELVLTAAWGFLWWRHKRPRGQRKRQKLVAKWDEWWQSHCWHWNLGGSKVTDVHEMGVTTRLTIAGVAGRHSIQHVNQVMHLIESGLDGYADIGLVRAEPVKGHANQFSLFLKKENPLRKLVEWDAALAPASVHEQYALGLTETGCWKMASLRANSFVIGATRTGKSNHLLVKLAVLTGCADDRQVLIDLKGGRSARPVLEAAAVDYVITEVDEARMYLRMLVAETLARAKHAYDGNEQLLATADVPAIHTEIDEVHGLTSVTNGDAECARLLGVVASQGSGLEIYVDVETQHGSLEESVRTEQTRGNLRLRVVYRVEEARHGQYVIPEYGKLDASRLEEQGTCYVKDGPKPLPEQVRAPKMPHPLLKQVAAQNARMVARPPLVLYCGDQVAYVAEDGREVTWQEWWDPRWLRLDPAFHAISPQYQAAVAASPAQAFQAIPEPPAPPPAPVPGEGSGAAAAARITAELDGTYGNIRNVHPPAVNLAPVVATQEDRFASALETAPGEGISPAQLMEESGMGRTWIHDRLKALVDAGAVTQTGRGRYAPVPGGDIRAAMEAIKDRGERLYREARATVSSAA
jgi:hypothetical protein